MAKINPIDIGVTTRKIRKKTAIKDISQWDMDKMLSPFIGGA
jgi:hypothetical protein